MPISLGVARGTIKIDTNSGQVRADMQRDMGAVNTTLEKTGNVADRVGKGLTGIGTALTGVSAGAGLIAGLGLKAASSVELVNIKFKSLTGSQIRADALMEKIANRAKSLNQPIQATQAAFAGLIPTIGTSQEAVDKYVSITARLASLNPVEGITGAIYAVREFASSGGTDIVSLAERFNIPKRRLRELVEQTGDLTKALDIALNEMGATEEQARAVGGSFSGSLARIGDAINKLIASGFKPLLDAVAPLLEKAADEVERLTKENPGLLKIAAGFSLVLAAAGPVLIILGQITSAVSALSKIDIAKGLSSGLGKVGVAGLAIGGGIALGVAEVKNRNIGGANDRAASQGISVEQLLFDDLKKGFIVLVNYVFQFVESLAVGVAQFQKIFDQLSNVVELGKQLLNKAFAGLVEIIGSTIVSITNVLGNLVASIPGFEKIDGLKALYDSLEGLSIRGESLKSQGINQKADSDKEIERLNKAIAKGISLSDGEISAAVKSVQDARDSFLKTLTDFFLPNEVEMAAKDAAAKFQEGFQAFMSDFGTNVGSAINDAITAVKAAAGIKSLTFSADQVEAFSQFQDDQKAIREKADADELAARKDHRDNLKKIDDDADAAIEAIHDRAKERAAADEQAIVDKRSEIAASAKDRVAADEQALQEKRAEIAQNTKDQLAEEETSYQTSRQKIVADAQKADLQLTKQYNDDLLSLIRDRREAASNLDARAVGRLNERKDELGTKLGEDRAANQKKLDEQLAEEDKQHQVRIAQIQAAGDKELAQFVAQQAKREQAQVIADEKELAKLIEKQQQQQQVQAAADAADIARINTKRGQEKQAEEAAFIGKLNQIVSQTNRELQLREQAFTKQFNQLAGAENAKLAIAGQGQAAMEAQLRNWYNRQAAILAGQAPTRSGSGPTSSLPRPGFGFALGSPLIPQDMTANIHRGEGIMSAPVAAMARSMLGSSYTQPQLGALLAGRQQGAAGSLALNWSGDVAIYDAGNRSDTEIKGLVEEGLTDGFLRLHAQLTGGKS